MLKGAYCIRKKKGTACCNGGSLKRAFCSAFRKAGCGNCLPSGVQSRYGSGFLPGTITGFGASFDSYQIVNAEKMVVITPAMMQVGVQK